MLNKQRLMEWEIRALKREKYILETPEEKKQINQLIKVKTQEYNKFSDYMGIRPKENRLLGVGERSKYKYTNEVKNNSKTVVIDYKVADKNIEKSLIKQSNKSWKKMYGSEQNALNEYSGAYYGVINRYLMQSLYKNDYFDEESMQNSIKKLDSILSKNELGNDLILYRGVSYKEFEYWKKNSVINEYKSTSISEEVANDFADGYNIIIKAPSKTKGYYLGNNSQMTHEKEFLMMRNQKYRILNIFENSMEVEFYE